MGTSTASNASLTIAAPASTTSYYVEAFDECAGYRYLLWAYYIYNSFGPRSV